MAKQYKSVSEMLRDTLNDKDFSVQFDQTIETQKLAKFLFSMRCELGVSQTEMAKRMSCSQSKISKIEHSTDDNLTFNDVMNYAAALGLRLGVTFSDQNATIVDEIKAHASGINDLLGGLAKIAGDDEEIINGVKRFYSEAFVNLVNIVVKNAAQLEKLPKAKKVVHTLKQVDMLESHSLEFVN